MNVSRKVPHNKWQFSEEIAPPVMHARFSVSANSVNSFELNRTSMSAAVLMRALEAETCENDHRYILSYMRVSLIVMQRLSNGLSCSTGTTVCFSGSHQQQQHERWKILEWSINMCDPICTQLFWDVIRRYCTSCCMCVAPVSLQKKLLAYDNQKIVSILKMVVCDCRKPRLGLLLIEHLRPVGTSVSQDIVALSVAVADAVMGRSSRTRTYESDHAEWSSTYLDRVPTEEEPCVPDKATDIGAWRRLITALLEMADDGNYPNRVVETLPRERQYTLGVLQVAVRYSEHDTFFLSELLRRRQWPHHCLDEAHGEALDRLKGLRGPNLLVVLRMLYDHNLNNWRRNHAAVRDNPVCLLTTGLTENGLCSTTGSKAYFVKYWLRVLAYGRGYLAIDVDAHNTVVIPEVVLPTTFSHNMAIIAPVQRHSIDPSDWMSILMSMIDAHDTDVLDTHSSEWDRTSSLFDYLLKHSLRITSCNQNNTHIVAYLLKVATEVESNGLSVDLDLVKNIVLKQGELLPVLLQAAIQNTVGEKHDKNAYNVCECLGTFILKDHREAVRLIVRAVGGKLSRNIRDPISNTLVPTLKLWIRGPDRVCAKSSRLGTALAATLNEEIERDFVELLNTTDWSITEKTEALVEATRLRCAIPVQVLLRPPHCVVPPIEIASDPWIDAISEFIYRPGQSGALAIVAGLLVQASQLDALPSRKRKLD